MHSTGEQVPLEINEKYTRRKLKHENNDMITKSLPLPLLLATALAGCASTDPYTGSTRNQIINVQYGTVENVQQVQMDASYGKDSLIGGALGLLVASTGSTGTQIAGAAVGAGLGALVAKETAGTGQRYTIQLTSGGDITIVTEQHDIVVGDCVSVEQGKHANVRRVSSVMCSTDPSHPAYDAMHSSSLNEAAECHTAKQQLINATTEQETDITYKKMRALCEH
jgi:outer membrane lipoprotein SlyB